MPDPIPRGVLAFKLTLKTFSALGVYGLSVLTAITAQNTKGVNAAETVAPALLKAQLDAVFTDVRIDAVKIGMLANAQLIKVVAAALNDYQPQNIVLDTVMISKSGFSLLEKEAVMALRDFLLPLADLITPNLPEAAALLGTSCAKDEKTMQVQGHELLMMGSKAVLIKGGHLKSEQSPDWFFSPNEAICFVKPRVNTQHIHGTGCTLSSAIAALRPQKANWLAAIESAKDFLQDALEASDRLEVGQGEVAPLHHFYRWW